MPSKGNCGRITYCSVTRDLRNYYCEPFALLRINSAKQSLSFDDVRLPRPHSAASQ